MTKLFGALLVLVFFLLIVGAKKIFQGTKNSYHKAKVLADKYEDSPVKIAPTDQPTNEKVSSHDNDDSEFDEKYYHLRLFLDAQELLLSMGEKKPTFESDRQRLKYLYFVMGAIDQLSRTIEDKDRSDLWRMTASMARAGLLFNIDDAMEYLEGYGSESDPELFSAGERGWQAMRTYILSAVGKATRDEFQKSCNEMFAVVRGIESRGT